ncbi:MULTISPECIES: hydroxypyruvate isomerase family protein [unclassified Haloferax]|uniref:hydroxypyruvate isomerase family protein n=1 Tax=unclassified Haloferax TaxID=2625095 RepID=UPI0002AFDFF4|nr:MULTISPECIES: TIM barrel protein [unclassified Haloferax]ELZ61322.1 hydroxypyruvate isomerase [Haloferax sp. ATCC BAA-645]ELZ62091.1 hydroxypyruvate isomerase [Haloferax sp. ATCC BAA-646]ELZ71331.1 hydroxypyruvate isomerase [Haloferax sp. ATCC BAA-644]
MVNVSVCVEMVYNGPFPDRIRRAAEVGADAVEFWGWREKDLDTVTTAVEDADIPLAACTAGGVLTDPAVAEDAIDTIKESITTANRLGCSTLIVTTGPDQRGLDRNTQRQNIINVLSEVGPTAESVDVTLVVEPLNTAVDHPGYFLTTSYEGFEIIDAVRSPNVKLLYDLYHQQISEGNIIATLTNHINSIGHFHLADVPGRHQPGTGELNVENIFNAIDDTGYDGYVGCEFVPTGDPDQSVRDVIDLA